jgi:very-short-patch-repair endonuclease
MEENLITCKVCGFKSQRIYGRHLKSHGLTSEDYKRMFPGEPLYCENDLKNTSKNSGKHMKEEKYKKMFSGKIKRDKNPNHKSKTTLEQRQKCSPFSEKFVNYNDENKRKEFIKKVCDKKSYTTRLDYWLNKGMSEEEAKEKLSNRQKTFTLEKCIQKYGKEEGRNIYDDRQERWQISLLENGNLKCGFSKISQDLFYSILNFYENENKTKIYFATKNQEYFISKGKGEFYQYDFVDLLNKKIIEYNGDEYHANPEMFEADEYPHPFRKNITAAEIWEKDRRKLEVAKEEGFEVITIWDSEYRKNKNNTLDRCLSFLKLKIKENA